MLKTPANPAGTPMDAFDQLRTAVQADRSQFFRDLSLPFYGYNRPGAKVSQGVRDSFWLQGMLCGFPGCLRLHQGFLGDGLHRRSQEIRRAHPDSARR